MTDLKDKNIIVTGASGGIGNSIIEKLNIAGANILASGTKIEKLDQLKEKLEGWGKLSIENLKNAITRSKIISLEKFIFSIGIRHIGQENAKILAAFFISIDEFCKLFTVKKRHTILKNLANKQDNKLQNRTELLKKVKNSDIN